MKTLNKSFPIAIILILFSAFLIGLATNAQEYKTPKDVWAGYVGWANNPDSLDVYIDMTWSEAEKDSCRAAMARWNAAGCVPKFRETSTAANAEITVTQGNPGDGNAGLWEGKPRTGKLISSTITVGKNTTPGLVETLTHELGHAIGLNDTEEDDNPGDVMKGSGPSNGSNGNLSQHDSTEMRAATASITAIAEDPPEHVNASFPETAIAPGEFTELIFSLPGFYPPETELIVQAIEDPLLFVEYAFLNGDQLLMGIFSDFMHGSGTIYLDITIFPFSGDPYHFWGIHYINSNPVPPITFSCPFEVVQSDGLVHVNWRDFHNYPFPNPLRSELHVDGFTRYKVKPNGDYTIQLEPGFHMLELFVDDFQVNSAYSSLDIFVEEPALDAIILNWPDTPPNPCQEDDLIIDFSLVEVLNAEFIEWTVVPEDAGVFDGIFILDPEYVGDVIISLHAFATPPGLDAMAVMEFEVYSTPLVICPGDFVVCLNNSPWEFFGAWPEEGIYSGPGVEGDLFFPEIAGLGLHDITYTYTDPTTACSGNCGFIAEVIAPPTAHAGGDATINGGEDYIIVDASASNFIDLIWTSTGDGTFDDPSSPNPIYTHGELDAESGQVELCLNALPIPPCSEIATSCMTLTIDTFTPSIPPWDDGFEDYDLGSDIVGQGNWEFWFGGTSSPSARVTNEQVHTGDQALKIMGAEDFTGDDIVHQFAGCTAGIWEVSTWQFIPANAAGGSTYFVLLDQYGNTPELCHWATQVKFDADLNIVESDYEGASLPLIKGEWTELKIVIDLDNDNQTIIYNGELLSSKSWTLGIPQPEAGILNIAAINMVANDLTVPVYYDDMMITDDLGSYPIITCPPNVETVNDPGICGATNIDLGYPEIEDPYGIEAVYNDAPSTFPVGSTSVTWVVINVIGGTASCEQNVEVFDTEEPFLPPMPDLEGPNDPGDCGAVVSWPEPVATDNCGVTSLESNYYPGMMFPVGLTYVEYVASDESGNETSEGFTITVLDEEPPVLPPMPDLESPNDPGECGAELVWEPPAATDNCGIGSLESNFEPGMMFPVGLTDVMYTATDVYGNQGYGGFTITVLDEEPPVLPPMPDLESPNDPDECGAELVWEPPVPADNCGVGSLESNFEPGMMFPVGLTDVIYTATDVHGNPGFTGFTVMVLDTEPPDMSCPDDLEVNINAPPFELTEATPEGGWYEGPGVSDGIFDPAVAGIGNHMITYNYNNPSSGCPYDCGFYITVIEGEGQLIVIPEGWSGISSYIEPITPSLDIILNPIYDDLMILYNNDGMYYPNEDINTLWWWDTYSGYIIKVEETVNLIVDGEEVTDKTLLLTPGWEIIPVLSTDFYNIEELFTGTPLTIVKEVAGSRIYWKEYGINTIEFVEPGKSYHVLMDEPAEISFNLPVDGKAGMIQKPEVQIENPWNPVSRAPSSHVIAFNLNEQVLNKGDIVAGFDHDNLCAGYTQLNDQDAPFALTLFGNDPYSRARDDSGFEPGEWISYQLYRPATNETFQLEVSYNPVMNTGNFEVNGLSEVTAIKMAPLGISTLQSSDISIYPNPSDGTFTIEGIEGLAEIKIFNAFGEEIYLSEKMLPTKITLTQAKGIYFINIITNKGAHYEKIIIN